MPRFYLDVITNENVATDNEGQEFADLRAAHRDAVMALAEIAADKIPQDGPLYLAVTIYDGQRQILARTHLHFEPGDQT